MFRLGKSGYDSMGFFELINILHDFDFTLWFELIWAWE